MHCAKIAGLLLAGLLFTVGCSPLRGALYSNVKEPGAVDGFRHLAAYECDTGAGPGSKVGEVKVENVLFAVAWGDASVEGACKAGGITKIHTIDTHFMNYWFVYSVWTTRVTGE